MPRTLADLRSQTLIRLGDEEESIWSAPEIDQYLIDGYLLIARQGRVFWDQLYVESLPPHFSVTQPWELAMLDQSGDFKFGVANYTMDDERQYLDEDEAIGPAWYTSPDDAAFLESAGASTAISATTELPDSVAELDRLTWNNRAIDALTQRMLRAADSRYELTAGDVYGYAWQQDGVRTLRIVRVPSALGDAFTFDGSWGILRDPSDIFDGLITHSGTVMASDWGRAWGLFWFSADEIFTATDAWGLPRQITGQHPLGPEAFGIPRRVYQDGTNVRVEHWRQGRPLDSDTAECELPTRYADYLQNFALWQSLMRPSAGQDLQLAAHYQQRWDRNLARIQRRTQQVETQRVMVMGGGRIGVTRPPSPVYPWNFGVVVR